MAEDTPTTAPAPSGPAPLPLPKGVVTRVDPAALIEESKANRSAEEERAFELAHEPLRHSETLGQLATALAKAQKVMPNAKKDSLNPFFKSSYASGAAVRDAYRDALADQEIAIFQLPRSSGRAVVLTTMLVHSSGEWIEDRMTLLAQQDTAQAVVSCITYARRCMAAAMTGVAIEDDDGEAAVRDLPKATHWDKATGKLQEPGVSSPTGPGRNTEQEKTGTTYPAPPLSPPAADSPVTAAGTAANAPVAGPPPVARPPVARPKASGVAVPAAVPLAGATVTPPPPGMKPPQRME